MYNFSHSPRIIYHFIILRKLFLCECSHPRMESGIQSAWMQNTHSAMDFRLRKNDGIAFPRLRKGRLCKNDIRDVARNIGMYGAFTFQGALRKERYLLLDYGHLHPQIPYQVAFLALPRGESKFL